MPINRGKRRYGCFSNKLPQSIRSVLSRNQAEELLNINDDMLARGKISRGWRLLSPNPQKLMPLRWSSDVVEKWKAIVPAWQALMAEAGNAGE